VALAPSSRDVDLAVPPGRRHRGSPDRCRGGPDRLTPARTAHVAIIDVARLTS